jgi:hypothetical protein
VIVRRLRARSALWPATAIGGAVALAVVAVPDAWDWVRVGDGVAALLLLALAALEWSRRRAAASVLRRLDAVAERALEGVPTELEVARERRRRARLG